VKDLIVHVDNSASCATRIGLAARLAKPFDAHLIGVYAQNPTFMPLGEESLQSLEAVAVAAPESMEYDPQIVRSEEKAAERAFRTIISKHKIVAQWRTMVGAAADVVVAFSRFTDMVLVGQTAPAGEDLAGEVALRSGRPVLVIPDAGSAPRSIESVLVAWDASREAARALHDALPLLQRATQVTVLSVGPAEKELPGIDIGEHLKRHGIQARFVQANDAELNAGPAVLAQANELACDLIVMGAYGHSKLRERVLGGTTYYVLKHMITPLLLAH
jgi:nucleotide-binding universal stress UspA family protein